jgi:succinate dehydrogenase / fumarate reductase flavoprotein subunit
MLDAVVVDGKCRGIIARNLLTGELERHSAHAVVLCTGGYGNVFYLSTNAMMCNTTAAWRAHRRGAFFGNPCYTQIHPTCIPVSGDYQSKLTLMSESLRNDGRVLGPQIGRRPHERPAADRRSGPRLLPRTPIPGFRQPGAARYCQPGRQNGLRRRAGRR